MQQVSWASSQNIHLGTCRLMGPHGCAGLASSNMLRDLDHLECPWKSTFRGYQVQNMFAASFIWFLRVLHFRIHSRVPPLGSEATGVAVPLLPTSSFFCHCRTFSSSPAVPISLSSTALFTCPSISSAICTHLGHDHTCSSFLAQSRRSVTSCQACYLVVRSPRNKSRRRSISKLIVFAAVLLSLSC